MPVNSLIDIRKTSQMLGVDITTLRYWDKSGKLKARRTAGGHRRYLLSDIQALQSIEATSSEEPDNEKVVAVYARVSSHEQKQKGDLDRQKGRLLEYCVKNKYEVKHIFEEVGSGMSDTRSKLNRLCDIAEKREISKLVVEHKDRLTRFNYRLYERYFKSHGVDVIHIEETLPKSYEAELVEDIMSLVASSSSKIYGKRSMERLSNQVINWNRRGREPDISSGLYDLLEHDDYSDFMENVPQKNIPAEKYITISNNSGNFILDFPSVSHKQRFMDYINRLPYNESKKVLDPYNSKEDYMDIVSLFEGVVRSV